jgi:hypothetical protein
LHLANNQTVYRLQKSIEPYPHRAGEEMGSATHEINVTTTSTTSVTFIGEATRPGEVIVVNPKK